MFVYAAMLAGLAGWLYAHFQRSVSPGPFGISAGTEYLLMAVLGGAGRVYGAILGAAGITVLRDQLQNFLPWLVGNTGNFEAIAFGAVLVLILQFASSGLWPILFGPPPAPTPPVRRATISNCRTVHCRRRERRCCRRKAREKHSAGWSRSTMSVSRCRAAASSG